MARRKRRKRSYNRGPLFDLSPETKRGVIVIILFALGGISVFSLFDMAGQAGPVINRFLAMIFGAGRFIFPLIAILVGYFLLRSERYEVRIINWLGLFLFMTSFHGLLSIRLPLDKAFELAQAGRGGGYLGLFLSYPLQKIIGFWVALIILVAVFFIAFLIMFNTSLARFFAKGEPIFSKTGDVINGFKMRRLEKKYNGTDGDDEEDDEEEEGEEEHEEYDEEEEGEETNKVKKKSDGALITRATRVFNKLSLDLLDNKSSKPTSGNIRNNQMIIQKTLENFGIAVEMGAVQVGPTVTQYTLKPSEGVKLAQITTLNNDLSLALAAHPIRIEAPIPGKALVGIEVPNQTAAIVTLREVLLSNNFKKRQSSLEIALGKDVAGEAWLANLGKMPHLLIAGSTGSGKTVGINAMIVSLLYQNSPDELKFIMIDPKRVELPIYNDIPHLLNPVITNAKKTVNALKWAIREMDRRFELLAKFHHRDINTFNQKMSERLPYIVIVIDELADLMAADFANMEAAIVRLAQMARAVGIHLVLATQRPSVEVITGLIKANITSRIAFSVASMVDSRTILDSSGAEKLLGRGDMLFTSAEISKPKRLQGVYVSDAEIKRIAGFLRQQGKPEYIEEVTADKIGGVAGAEFGDSSEDGDELLPEAKEVIFQAGKASASLLQRRLKIGYARAARILDLLEDAGLIGPAEGAKPREVYFDQQDKVVAEEESVEEEYEEESEEPEEENEEEEEEEENEEEEEEEEEYKEEDEEEEKK